MPKGGTSHENASVCISDGNCSCTDRSERVAAQRTICLRSEDLGIQDRSVMIPIITNHFSKEVSYYREYVYRLHIIVG